MDQKGIVILIELFYLNKLFFYNLLAINKTKTLKNDVLSFAPGDQVEVCEDELINLQGTIFGIDGDSIRILAKHEASKDEIAFKANELRKYFSVGNHVKVLNGRYLEGETGMIVGIDGIKDEVCRQIYLYNLPVFLLILMHRCLFEHQIFKFV
jgi:transcription antitermination factor NusG